MIWGDFLSVIQLAAGLNTAYFSFTELRQPVFGSEARALDNLKLTLDTRLAGQDPQSARRHRDAYLQLLINFQTLQHDCARKDIRLGQTCLAAAIGYVVLLVGASFGAHVEIGPATAAAISIIGFGPLCLCVRTNVVAMQRIRTKVSDGRSELERALMFPPEQAGHEATRADDR